VGVMKGVSLRMEGPGPISSGGSIERSVGSTAHSVWFKLPKVSKRLAPNRRDLFMMISP